MDFLDRTWLGNPVGAWLAAAAVAVVGATILSVTRKILLRYLPPLARRTPTKVDDLVVAVIGATKTLFLFGLPLLVGLGLLDLGATADTIVGHARTAVVILQLGFWVSAGVNRWAVDVAERRATKDKAGVTSISVLRIALVALLWVLTMLILLDNLGVDVMTLIAGLGVGGVAIALAVQGILSDLVASVVIVLDKPFVIGDWITVGDMTGMVEKIGLKTTRIRSLSGEEIVFSHSDLIGSRIKNYRTQRERRVQFTFGLAYETPTAALREVPAVVRGIIVAAQGAVVPARVDRCHVASYGESAIVVETVYIVEDPDYNRYMDLHHRILLDIHEALAAREISFGLPASNVHLVEWQRAATSEPTAASSATSAPVRGRR